MFKTNAVLLQNLLNDVASGKIRLPDFQRKWIWDDYRIRGLLASISRGFPVGAVLTLGAGGTVRFKADVLEGVDSSGDSISQFLLDGQQRLTSLYQALVRSEPVEMRRRGRRIRLWYYIDMHESTSPTGDKDNAVVSVPENKIIARNFDKDAVLDLSSPEREYAQHMFPANRVFDPLTWTLGYIAYWNDRTNDRKGEPADFMQQFNKTVIKSFAQYQLPVIRLAKNAPKEAVCTVFEKINTGGVSLTAFELVTASFAAETDDFSLRVDWDTRKARLYPDFGGVLQGIDGIHFLQAVTLLWTQERRRRAMASGEEASRAPPISCKKRDVLDLPLQEYQKWADKVECGFRKAAKFLQSECVYGRHNVPYSTQLVPMAALYVHLDKELDPELARRKLARWYWCGVFGEAYGGTIETRYSEDLAQVTEFVRNGTEPSRIEQASFLPERLLTLRTRNSAAYKGVYALQMKRGARDWSSGQELNLVNYRNEAIDIHHVFPVAWCKRNDIPARVYNSIINKTPLSACTNKKLGGAAPSEYLERLRADVGDDEGLRKAMEAHWLNIAHLRSDSFRDSFVYRGEKLLELIGDAMGRDIGSGKEVFEKAVRGLSSGKSDESDYGLEEPEYSPLGEDSPEDDLVRTDS